MGNKAQQGSNRIRNQFSEKSQANDMSKLKRKTFRVAGAGHIELSADPNCETGNARGFYFNCSWSQYASGGVLGVEEARKLAKAILKGITVSKKYTSENITKRVITSNHETPKIRRSMGKTGQ